MKVIVVAYDCSPCRGSEFVVGWNYSIALSEYCEVIVITAAYNQKDIEKYLQKQEFKNIRFEYVKTTDVIIKYKLGLNELFCTLETYYLWQKTAYKRVKEIVLAEKIQVIHHVTLGDFRIIGKMWKLGIPFVYGPVGGGQETPSCLMSYVAGKRAEKVRAIINRLVPYSLGFKKGLERASIILVSNDETRAIIEKHLIKNTNKIRQLCELSMPKAYLDDRTALVTNGGVKRLFYHQVA